MAQSNLWMQQMFDIASKRYVLSNKILTFGQDEKWRQAVLEEIGPGPDAKILDICTGTADLALKIAGRFPRHTIYALDFSKSMLTAAKERARQQGAENIVFEEGDVTGLRFDSNYFDYVTVSFGFRNLSFSDENLRKALKEVYRILKQGGRFIIIETSQPKNIFIRKLFHLYAANIVPALGALISKEDTPYKYLGNSIVKFFGKEKLMDILGFCGFREEKTKPFMSGAVLLSIVKK